ncbi:Proteasome subunit beta type [Spironucleus salmonicida]|uniref:proteasome endopeptidase complex n=1 Tax=Spironucleus salmonicida TaxID=348837 RepID=V6LXV7_9EUKA|nr:Proteasome subunit beta type [Spironucleus salmonicida]|eukprot:EST48546.1 Proteasome subunit beta type [Spironucleus salmonicida]
MLLAKHFGINKSKKETHIVGETFAAPKIHPSVFFKTLSTATALTESAPKKWNNQKGTTTLAFSFQGGIIISVDSRSTMGPYISSGNVHKVIPITQHLLGTMAGGAADCQFWLSDLGKRVAMHELETGDRLGATSASKLFADTIHQYAGYDLSIGSMIAGFDADGTPKLWYCDNDGDRLEGYLFSVGSGSMFAYSILENGWKWDLTDQEAIDLGIKAVMHAVHRDAMSGGMQAVFLVKENGWELVKKQDNYISMQKDGFLGNLKDLPRSVV